MCARAHRALTDRQTAVGVDDAWERKRSVAEMETTRGTQRYVEKNQGDGTKRAKVSHTSQDCGRGEKLGRCVKDGEIHTHMISGSSLQPSVDESKASSASMLMSWKCCSAS